MRKVDSKSTLVEYVKKHLTKNYSQDSLRWALIEQGYSRSAVDNAIKQVNKEIEDRASIKEKPVISHQIIDENDNPVIIKKPWWKRIFE